MCGRSDARKSTCITYSSSLHNGFADDVVVEIISNPFGDSKDVLQFREDCVLVLRGQFVPHGLKLSDEAPGPFVFERGAFEEGSVSFEDVLDMFVFHLIDVFPEDQRGLLRVNVVLHKFREALKVFVLCQFKQVRTQTDGACVVVVTQGSVRGCHFYVNS